MARLGMDVERVESAARSLLARANELGVLVVRVDGIVRQVPAAWEGPQARAFTQEWWPAQRRVLVAAGEHVAGLARSALDNAAQQREASTAGTGRDGGSTAPPSAADRWDVLKSKTGSDGVRIQAVRGAEGVTRYVVYLDGTDPWSLGNRRILDNLAEVGVGTGTRDYILQQMRAMIPKDAEVMVLGYSQGGIHAQYLAASGEFHITDVMTFGSPFHRDVDVPGGTNFVRVRDVGDPVPGLDVGTEDRDDLGEIGDKIATAWRSILGDDAGAVQHEVDRLNRGNDLTFVTSAQGVDHGMLGSHTDPRTYHQGAEQYEALASRTAGGRAVLASQSRYNGRVVSDSDERITP